MLTTLLVLLIIVGIGIAVYKILNMPLDLTIAPRLMADLVAATFGEPRLPKTGAARPRMRDITPGACSAQTERDEKRRPTPRHLPDKSRYL